MRFRRYHCDHCEAHVPKGTEVGTCRRCGEETCPNCTDEGANNVHPACAEEEALSYEECEGERLCELCWGIKYDIPAVYAAGMGPTRHGSEGAGSPPALAPNDLRETG